MAIDPITRLNNAYAELKRRNEKITVRSLKTEAECGTDAAREWLANNQRLSDLAANLPMPDLSDAMKIVWAHAITTAIEDVKDVADERAEDAETAEADALGRAAQAEAHLKRITEEMERTRAEIERVKSENAQIRQDREDERGRHEKELERLREEVKIERSHAEEANTRAVAAEATVTTLNGFLADLKPAPAKKSTSRTKADGQTTRTAQ